jgi:DNA-binding transcriptional MerR regulator
MAGVSTRTLRYYDEIGLLKPARISSSGYRIYGRAQVELLQQILFYRAFDVSLDEIKKILNSPGFDKKKALADHHARLLDKRDQLDLLIANVKKTIDESEGRMMMTDKEKFEGFKQKLLEDNEAEYGGEIRGRFGDETVNESNRKILNMTKEEYEEVILLSENIKQTLAEAFKTGNPAGELAQKAADLHRKWLSFYWSKYTKQAHAGVAQMYVDDPRFSEYYDKDQPGTAQFFRDAIWIYTGMKN